MEIGVAQSDSSQVQMVAAEEDNLLPSPEEVALKRWRVQTFRVALEVGTRPRGALRSAREAAEVARSIFADLDHDREHFAVLMLDVRHRLIGFKVIASGSNCSIAVRPREIFRAALLMNATSIVVAHNHPSGEPEPSGEDISLTQVLRQTGQLVGIEVIDHLVIGDGQFMSLRERGYF